MKLKMDVVIRDIAGESIAIPIGKGASEVNGLISLTPSGELLIRRLQQECQPEDLVACLLERYDVEREQAEKDVALFLRKLAKCGLL